MQTFSDDTGQVYVETTTPAQSMITSFMNNCTGRQQDPRHYQHPSGAAKLVHMATRTSVWNIYDPGMPETLPYFSKEFEVMKRIYLHLKET
jgi:lipocalin